MHDSKTRECNSQGLFDFDGGETLDGSGFENEMPEPEFHDLDREDQD